MDLVVTVVFITFPARGIAAYKLSVINGFIISLEQMRYLMKSHAFVRVEAEEHADLDRQEKTKQLRKWRHKFQNFNRFLWMPVLVYRNEYPQSRRVRWNLVGNYAVQMLAMLVVGYCLLTKWIFPPIKEWTMNVIKGHSDVGALLSIIIRLSTPTSLMIIFSFYSFLHCWSNMFAEALQFEDRQFYADWWNAQSIRQLMRRWNTLVYNWLYTYIYRDVHLLLIHWPIIRQSRILLYTGPYLAVMLISGYFHDYVFRMALNFWMPMTFVTIYLLNIPLGLLPINKRAFKVMNQVFSLFTGSFAWLSYSGEWHAQQMCKSNFSESKGSFVPLLLTCRLNEDSSEAFH